MQLQAYLQGLCNTDVFADMGFHKFVGLAPNVDLDAYDDTTGYEEVGYTSACLCGSTLKELSAL
eukprot:SAG31_NODE_123_length_23712_cov_41.426291_21_plen_64_part_00